MNLTRGIQADQLIDNVWRGGGYQIDPMSLAHEVGIERAENHARTSRSQTLVQLHKVAAIGRPKYAAL
jgi:hypothetical protein